MIRQYKNIIFRIKRWNPSEGRWKISSYTVPVYRGMTILDGLLYIKEKLDHSLSFRASCRMGICGSCGMFINGIPRLACETQILDLKTEIVSIEPLKNFELIKDLAVDFSHFYQKLRKIMPYLLREDLKEYFNPTIEYRQLPSEFEKYIQFSYCINCGLCYSACPTNATNLKYLGPSALTNTLRYVMDSRDEGYDKRLITVDTPDGVWGCHLSGACSEVCPKGVDPALAIQILRRAVVLQSFNRFKKEISSLAVPGKPVKRRDIPQPPPITVKKKPT